MKKPLIILVLLFGFSNVSKALSNDEYILQFNEKISNILENSDYRVQNIEDYTIGVWTTQDANLGKEQKFIYLSSWSDLLVYEVNEQNDLNLKKHIYGHYGIDEVKEVDFFIPNVSNLSIVSISGGTGHEARYRHVLYLTNQEEILSFDYIISDRDSPGVYLACAYLFDEWCKSIRELINKGDRANGLELIIDVEAVHNYVVNEINFFASVRVEIDDEEVFDQFKQHYNYKGPYENILLKKISIAVDGEGAELYTHLYECLRIDGLLVNKINYPYTSGKILDCINP